MECPTNLPNQPRIRLLFRKKQGAPPRPLPLASHPPSRSRNPSMQPPASSSPEETQPAASDVLASSSHWLTQPVGDDTTSEPLSSADSLRPLMEQWVEISEESCFDPIPPVCMVRFPGTIRVDCGSTS
jgi:hypothetical protein